MEECIKDYMVVSDVIKDKIFNFLRNDNTVKLETSALLATYATVKTMEAKELIRGLQMVCLWKLFGTDANQVSFGKVLMIVNDYVIELLDQEIYGVKK